MRWSQAHYVLARMISAGKMLLWVSPGLAVLLREGRAALARSRECHSSVMSRSQPG